MSMRQPCVQNDSAKLVSTTKHVTILGPDRAIYSMTRMLV